jgi:MFS family permease
LVNKTLSQRLNKNALSLIWAGAFMDIFAFTILNPFLPRFYLDLGAPLAQIGLLLAVSAFIGFFSGILWGKLSDRYGRKPILLICRLGALAGYLILAFSTNITMVVISRVVDGIFSRSILVSLTAVGDIVKEEKRSAEMSKVGIPWIAGGLVGPAIGGLLSSRGLLGIGLACAGLSSLTFLNTFLTFKETHPIIGQSLADRTPNQTSTARTSSFGLLRKHNPRVLLSLNFFAFLSHIIFITTMTLYLTKRFGLTVGQIGGLFTVTGSINLAIRLLVFPHVLRRFGDRKTFRIGLLAFMAAFALLFFNPSMIGFVLVIALISFGATCSVDVMHGIMSRSVQRHEQGQMMGLNAMIESASFVIAPIIGGYLLSLDYPGFYPMSAMLISLIALALSQIPLKPIPKKME